MNDKELYKKKKQALLDGWQAEVDKLKAKASKASADVQLKLNKQIEILKGKIEEGKSKLAEISKTSDDAWESIKDGMESTWTSMKSAFTNAVDKFKK
jgi:DNA-binding transcriptional regulator GbsR (MarR family)